MGIPAVRPIQADLLYELNYPHIGGEHNYSNVILRPPRQSIKPVVHYGQIASVNSRARSIYTRDLLSQESRLMSPAPFAPVKR